MNAKNFPKRLDSKTSYLRITVPENLDLALEGLIRKVLKEQPKIDDIYSFAANYFETLLKIRDRAGAKFTADQLCPFHSDEDAHEMIKLAGTFSKPNSKELRKKDEESLLLPKTENAAKNNDLDNEAQDKKTTVRKLKSKKVPTVERNKQAIPELAKQLPAAVKSITDEEKKQTTVAHKQLGDVNMEKNAKKEESDDEEFLATDPIKELVEKELMETQSSGKRKEIKETAATNSSVQMTSDESMANTNIQEEQKPVDNINVQSELNDANEPFKEENSTIRENLVEKDEENKTRSEEIEETKAVKVNEIKSENNQAIEKTSEKSTSDVKEEKKIKPAEEVSDKQLEDAEKGNEESIRRTTEINLKNATDLKIVTKEETKSEGKTNESTENTEEKKITAEHDDITMTENHNDKASDLKTAKLEEQILTQKMQSEDKLNNQSIEMIKGITDGSSETLNDVIEKDANKAVSSEIFETNNVKEQNEKNVKTSQEMPPNQIQFEEKEPKEPLNDQQIPRVNNPTGRETATKDENSESAAENKTEETSVINLPPVTEPDSEVEVNDNQELKEQEKRMTEDEAEPAVTIKAKDINPKKDEPTSEALKKTELNIEVDANQTEQTSIATVQVKDIQMDKPENTQYVLKNDEKPLKTGNITEDNKDENTIQNAEALQSKAIGTKLTAEEVISINENTVDEKLESESSFLKGKPDESSSTDKKSSQSQDNDIETSSPKPLSDSANPNEAIKSEKNEKLLNEYRVKTIEDTLFGEKTHDFEQDNEDSQTPEDVAVTSKERKEEISETQEEQQGVNKNVAESQLTAEGSITQQEENVQKLEDEASGSLNLNTNKPSTEKMNEVLTSGTPDIEEIQSKDDKIESKKELREGESDNQNSNFKAEDGSVKAEEDSSPEVVTRQIPKDDETSSDKSKFKTSNRSEEIKSNSEDELCTVADVQQISKEDEISRNKLEEKYKLEAENTQNKEDKTKVEERTIKEEKLHIITVEEADKTEKNQEISQPSGEVQVKTIQSHYYNTLQVPETVTKEYRVHNISSPTVGALLNVASSLQQGYEHRHELLNKEEPSEKVDDVNMNTTVEKASNLSSFTELAKIPTEDEKFDNLQSGDQSIKSGDHELDFNAQKSDSDDLLDLMTPISGFSPSFSELSWQTINELFIDSEKRHSSLEKEENRYATPKTNNTTGDSGEQEAAEVRQEIEEVIHKSVVSSNREAVPVPPRDLETNKQTPESVEEKKKEKPEGESAESSSDSSNEQISVNDDTPFISVEVKTVIETQILDDDEADDDGFDHNRNKEQNCEEKTPPDMKIKVETTIDFVNEVEMSQSESEHGEDKTETTVGTRRNGLKSSLEVQDKNRHEKSMESSSTEQTTGGEGSSGESDSTISSAATEIKRADFAKRNFSSTRSLLSTQSLDLEKKNQLMKTMSLSTFRHGVTDFEVWNTIEKELEEAATKIQSKFRGYKTRKKLQRENAVQITTEESSGTEEIKNECQQSTGEFHDSIVLSEHPC